jgi:dTDP-4-dehydrorhamnose reductase
MMPERIENLDRLEALLSEPTAEVVDVVGRVKGDLLLLGVGGKMGPSLARMAKRASEAAGVPRRVIGVSRFKTNGLARQLERDGIETIPCDLLDPAAVEALPEAANVIYMVGMKFGTTGQEATTWAMNSFLPGLICQRFSRSRIAAFSTGNVYGLTEINAGGSREEDPPEPVGEYAMSCLGRERVLEHFSRVQHIPMSVIRLNYACELRYGVLVDLAQKIRADQPVDLSMGYLNTIWQGDANAMALQCLEQVQSPPWLINITGPECLSVRDVSEKLGRLLGKEVRFTGVESDRALLANSRRAIQLFGEPRVSVDQLLGWVAEWSRQGGPTLGKPTHFESLDGRF